MLPLTLFSMVLELACERECSRGEDYRLIKLTIIDYNVENFYPFFVYIFLLFFFDILTKLPIVTTHHLPLISINLL